MLTDPCAVISEVDVDTVLPCHNEIFACARSFLQNLASTTSAVHGEKTFSAGSITSQAGLPVATPKRTHIREPSMAPHQIEQTEHSKVDIVRQFLWKSRDDTPDWKDVVGSTARIGSSKW